MGYVSLWSEAYVSLGTAMSRSSPHWSGSTAIMTTISLVITAHTMIHHVRHQHTIIHLPCIILAPFCSKITPLWFLQFSWPTRFLTFLSHYPASLDPHSFNYSPLSRLCSLLLSLPHSLCNCSIFTYNVLSLELLFSHGHSSIYSVVTVRCI